MTNENIDLLLMIGIPALIFFGIWLFHRATRTMAPGEIQRLRKLSDEIDEEGIPANAVVQKIDYISTGTSGHVQTTYVEWTLRVPLPGGETCDVSADIFGYDSVRFSLNPVFAAYAGRVGAIIPVIVHPREHEALRIDDLAMMKLMTAPDNNQ